MSKKKVSLLSGSETPQREEEEEVTLGEESRTHVLGETGEDTHKCADVAMQPLIQFWGCCLVYHRDGQMMLPFNQ